MLKFVFHSYYQILLLSTALLLAFIFHPVIIDKTKKSPPTFTFISKDQNTNEITANHKSVKRSQSSYDLSVVIPAYNEENRLPIMLNSTLDFLNSWKSISYEILIVDDGSVDMTVEIVKQYILEFGDSVKLIQLNNNMGKGAAVKFGVFHAIGKYILMVDADGATDITALKSLYYSLNPLTSQNPQSHYNIAIGSRAHMAINSVKSRSLHRTILMYGFHLLVTLFTSKKVKDTQCGFKLFDRETAKYIFENIHLDRWAFDIEVIYIAEIKKFNLIEIPVDWKEIEGSKLIKTNLDIVTTSLIMARDIVCVRLSYMLGIWKLS